MTTVMQPGLMVSDELSTHELIEVVELAEAIGYREFWYTDQRFWRDCYQGLALAARHSKTLLLGPGVNDPFTRHPATIAMSIATLDEISGGRAQLGLGNGGSGIKAMKLTQERPLRAVRECIELVRAMLTGEQVRYTGEMFHLDGGRLGFTPVRTEIPVFVASRSPQMLRLCGRISDGVLLGNMARRSAVEEAAALIREGEQAEGRAPGSCKINLRLEACISDEEDSALAAMKHRLAVRLVSSYPNWGYLDRLDIHPGPEIVEAVVAKDVERVATLISDADVRAGALVGSVESAATQLADLLTPDVTSVTIRPYESRHQGIHETIRAFVERVWPTAARSVPVLP